MRFSTASALSSFLGRVLGSSQYIDFTKGSNGAVYPVAGTNLKYGGQGAEFTIDGSLLARTAKSDWHISNGKWDVVMKAAPGQGVISCFTLWGDDKDEIDLEWLGGNHTSVQTNFFRQGVLNHGFGNFVDVDNTLDFHTYTIDYKAGQYIKWSIDGHEVRWMGADQAGWSMPSAPVYLALGNWVAGTAGGDSGVVKWAGGVTNPAEAPFTMYVKSITITDWNN